MKFISSVTATKSKTFVKLLPLLAGALSMSLSVASVPVSAQSNMPQASPDGGKPNQMHRQNWLNLSADQKEEMKRIKESERQQMDNILTSEQKARLETARANRENPRQVFESLNLSEEQKAKMQQVREASRQQFEAILTPEQRQKMQQHQQQRRQGPGAGQGTQTP